MVAIYVVALSFGLLVDASLGGTPRSALHIGSVVAKTSLLANPNYEGSYIARQADADAGGTWSLRLCNAYAYEGWIHVFHSAGRRPGMSYTKSGGDGEKRLTEASGPLPYKRCTDIKGVALAVGSLLKFRIGGDMHIATFSVDSLPMHGYMLQLVLKRRDTWSTAADFSSHVFAATSGPQVALVDAYLGPARSILEVRSMPVGMDRLHGEPGQEEPVHFGTVVDIASGEYEWRLMNKKGPRQHAEKASVEFKAVDGTPYTVLRVGTEAIGGNSFDEELIVWPSAGAEVRSGAEDHPDKGLFGLPTSLGKSRRNQRSRAASQVVSFAVVAAVVAALSGSLVLNMP